MAATERPGRYWYRVCLFPIERAYRPMTKTSQDTYCLRDCKAAVPPELSAENVCVHHFILSIEYACSDVRREMAVGSSTAGSLKIQTYIKSTAIKLSEVATGKTRLSDDLKKRVLSNLLALMNLQESVNRSSVPPAKAEPAKRRPEEIAQRAYEIYLRRGGEPGKESEDWAAAEKELIAENS